jgi:hypothetical protein
MKPENFLWWQSFREVKRQYRENDEYRMVCEIHAQEFNHKIDYVCKCNPSRIQKFIDDINLVYDKL